MASALASRLVAASVLPSDRPPVFFMTRSTAPAPVQPPAQQSPPVPAPVMPPATVMVAPIPPPSQRYVSLLEAIAAASSGFGDLTKDSDNTYLRSKYLSLPGLLKAIKQPLLEQGVAVYSQGLFVDGAWVVRTTLALVDSGQEVSSDYPMPDVTNLQRIGAAFTYGVRYNLFALLAICPEADDDGNSGAAGVPAHAATALPGLPGQPFAPSFGVMPQAYPQAMPQVYPQAMPAPVIANPAQPHQVLWRE